MSDNNFDKNNDSLAVVVKSFTLKDFDEPIFQEEAEPYIVTIAIDSSGVQSHSIDFNALDFPGVRKGDRITFDGQGHLVYGPKKPGEFLVYSILFMERDQDVRDLGAQVERIVNSAAVDVGLGIIMAANPTVGVIAELSLLITDLVTKELRKNKDDALFRRSGTLLRDVVPPYDILRTFVSGNKYIDCETSIIPLSQSNGLGSQVKTMKLQ